MSRPARAIRGPITLITVGVLFALNNFTQYSFDKTWPVLLIVFGLLSLLKRSVEPVPPPAPPPYHYRYPPIRRVRLLRRQAATRRAPTRNRAPAKGGFGTTAPRPADAGQTPPPDTRRTGMRRSFSGPLLLLAIGGLFLWHNLHPEAPIFDLRGAVLALRR